ncbi:hypothetical protein Lal_00037826 [Lupinus albus]|nr:hypothetical protein Lal_00037826 [Lupinus albus]
MKSVLQLFELSSSLKINFSKSNLFGVNLQEDSINGHTVVIQCKLYSNSFTYLGIPVGVSHKRKSTWTTLIDRIQSRLSSWNINQISFGGWVILLNGVLSALPLYYLSFYKAHVSIIRFIQKIQRSFLWGGCSSKRKIHWVNWEKMCHSKQGVDLGLTISNPLTMLCRARDLAISSSRKSTIVTWFGGGLVPQVVLQRHCSDCWAWRHDISRLYTVKSAYKLLTLPVEQTYHTNQQTSSFWKSIWKFKAPSKVISFVWRLFQGRIPTKDALSRRGVFSHSNGGILYPFVMITWNLLLTFSPHVLLVILLGN